MSRVGSLLRAARHPISQNAIALYGVQVATFVVPLVTLPYISRVLGGSAFGLVVFAQSFSFLLGLVIDWGFDSSVTRRAAAARDDRDRLADLVADVLGAKLVLTLLTAVVALAAYLWVPKLHDHPGYLALAWVAAVTQGLLPSWYFFGVERLRLPSVIQLASRVIAAALTFVLVRRAGDAWIVLALYAAVSTVSSVLVSGLVYRHVPLRLPTLERSLAAIRNSTILFLSVSALSLYTTANVVILGLLASSAQVGYFGAAERIVRAVVQLLAPMAFVIYPRIAYLHSSGRYERARKLAAISILMFGAIGLVVTTLLVTLAPTIITFVYGQHFREAVPVLRILAFILLPISLNATLQGGWMLSLHMDRSILRLALASGLTNVVLGVTLVELIGPRGMAVSVLCAEVVSLAWAAGAIRRRERDTKLPGLFAGVADAWAGTGAAPLRRLLGRGR